VAGKASADDEMISGINVTPLVDVTLVLLIIFIVTAKLVVVPLLPHDLPTAASAETTQVVFAVSIDREGRVAVDKRPIASDAELHVAAQAALAATPDLRVVIQAARDSRHGDVIGVMDELRRAGATKIGFATRPYEDPSPAVR
jgi:biopolymer transport protein ExbD